MRDLDIGKHWEGVDQGLPVLFIEVNGMVASLDRSLKRTLLEQFNMLFLGYEFENITSVTVELEPGRMETFRGFTQNETIVQLYRDFLGKE